MQKHREDAPSLTSQFLRHRQALDDVICREYLAAVNLRYLGRQVGIYLSFASPTQNSMNLKENTGIVQGKQLRVPRISVDEREGGRMCQTGRHPCLYFYCMFCVNNINIAFVQKYV